MKSIVEMKCDTEQDDKIVVAVQIWFFARVE